MSLINDYGEADFLDLDAIESFAEFCYNKGRNDGMNEAVEELYGKAKFDCLKVHDKLVKIDTVDEFLRRATEKRFIVNNFFVGISALEEIAESMKKENKWGFIITDSEGSLLWKGGRKNE